MFWQDTFALVQEFYHQCINAPFSMVITLPVFLLWLGLFLFPQLVMRIITLLPVPQNQLGLITKPIATIVLLSFARASFYILVLLFILTVIHYSGGQTMTKFLPEFTPFFSKDYFIIKKILHGETSVVFLLIVTLPLIFSMMIPNYLLVVVNFVAEVPSISLIVIAFTVTYHISSILNIKKQCRSG
jgi:hypothetical protein